MEFITVEQFQEQPKEVQVVFVNWWIENLSDFDLWFVEYGSDKQSFLNGIFKGCLGIEKEQKNIAKDKNYGRKPLFTEGQLRKFIEDKTGMRLEFMMKDYNDAIMIQLFDEKSFFSIIDHVTKEKDVLMAYWEVACIVANNTLKDETFIGCIKQSLDEVNK